MMLGAIRLDPAGPCDIQTALVERLRTVDYGLVETPVITADMRSATDSGIYIVVRIPQMGTLGISHGSTMVFEGNCLISCLASQQNLAREDAERMINLAESCARHAGSTPNEEYCLLQGMPVVTKISDASYQGQVTMRLRIRRPK